jgi:hypothetical protein
MAQVKRKAEEDPDDLKRAAAAGEGKETKQEEETAQTATIIYFTDDQSYDRLEDSAKDIEQFLEEQLDQFAQRVYIVPKTGKGQFALHPPSSKGTIQLAEEKVDLLLHVDPHLTDAQWKKGKKGTEIAKALDWVREYYEMNIEKPWEQLLWVIDEDRLPDLYKFMRAEEKVGYKDDFVVHALIQLMKSYVTEDRKYYGRDHFWMMLYGILRVIENALGYETRRGDEAWSSEAIEESVEEVRESARDDIYRSVAIPFLDYISAWIKGSPSIAANKKFLQTLQETILDPLLDAGRAYLAAIDRHFKDWNQPHSFPKQLLESKDDKRSGLLPLIRFVLSPGVKQAQEAKFPVFMLTEGHPRDVPLTDASKLMLDVYRSGYSSEEHDRIMIRQNTDILVDVLCLAWQDKELDIDKRFDMFTVNDDDGVPLMSIRKIESFMIWLVLVHPYWCKHERVAVIGAQNQDNTVMFHRLNETETFYKDRTGLEIPKPEGLKTFFYDWDTDLDVEQTLGYNTELLEWLIKKHPEYRKKQVDTFLFDTNLGMIQRWVTQRSPAGQEYHVKERKNTYLADGPPERKFDLSKLMAKSLTISDKSGSSKKAKVEPKPTLPPNMYTHISKFYTQGKAHNRRLLVDSDSDSEE